MKKKEKEKKEESKQKRKIFSFNSLNRISESGGSKYFQNENSLETQKI